MLAPSSEEELAEVIRSAKEPLSIQGGGTRGHRVAGAPLSVSGVSGITLYDPGALTLVARAGTSVAEIESALAAENQMLAFEPMDHRQLLGTEGDPTIGGVVAANVSGPRRVKAGACRDFLLGVRFVNGEGTIIKNGGRVMKNVTGYDLARLMCGARGTLGVLTEVGFKVLPKPEARATLMLGGLTDSEAVRAMSAALGSPYEVSGAAHHRGQKSSTMIRVEGFADSVRYRTGELLRVMSSFGDWTVQTDDPWNGIRNVEMFQSQPGDVWRLSVKPSDAPEAVSRINAEDVLFDWGGGLIWLRVPEGTDVRGALNDLAGHATLVRSARGVQFHPESDPLAALAKGLRQKFDPKGILNAGLIG